MSDKSIFIVFFLLVMISILSIFGLIKSQNEQCTGKNQFYAFGGRIYACSDWKPGE